MGERKPEAADELQGWKEIAAELGVTEKTARGYTKGHVKGLPLLVLESNFRGKVCTTRGHLWDWKASARRRYPVANDTEITVEITVDEGDGPVTARQAAAS